MKKLIAILSAVMLVGTAMAQTPVVSPVKIYRAGSDLAVDAGYLTVYNPSGTAAVSKITITSTDTNLFTVSPASATVSNNSLQVTLSFKTGLAAGNYFADVVIAQTNTPTKTITVPVSVQITRDTSVSFGSLADARIVLGNVGAMPVLPPRKYGDVLIGMQTATDASGNAVQRMNVWVSKGTSVSDWQSFGEYVQGAAEFASARTDTNATTTVTAYKPRYRGDMLVGGVGGTSTLWVASGTTTNDWKKIGP